MVLGEAITVWPQLKEINPMIHRRYENIVFAITDHRTSLLLNISQPE